MYIFVNFIVFSCKRAFRKYFCCSVFYMWNYPVQSHLVLSRILLLRSDWLYETYLKLLFFEQKKIIAIWFTNYPVLTSQFMKRNLRGEMTVVAKEDISILDFELIESVAQELRLSSTEVHVNACNKGLTKWYLLTNLNQSARVL